MEKCTHMTEDGKSHFFKFEFVPDRNVWNPFEPTCEKCGISIGDIIRKNADEVEKNNV